MRVGFRPQRSIGAQWLLLLLALWTGVDAAPAHAYSVLSHEQVVNLAWTVKIVPMLRARYPDITDAQLTEAHAYAYGGSVIQDMGYYPFGSAYFSDLVHYVRTGDFVATLIRESSTPDEYAFALGALAHYCGDVDGHPAVNEVTALENPKLEHKFGPVVTYEENHTAHVRTEFGFDVVSVARGRYAQQNYHDFVGFQVAKDLLNRAFEETYGVPVADVFAHEDLTISSYRHAVSELIPRMTVIALVSYEKEIKASDPSFNRDRFIYRLRKTQFEKEYGKNYQKPSLASRIEAFFLRILPKVGKLRVLKPAIPTPFEEAVYVNSIHATEQLYQGDLSRVKPPVEGAKPTSSRALERSPDLPEIDLDTGKPSRLGEYMLADQAYAHLLNQLMHTQGTTLTPDVRDSIADFYSDRTEPAWYLKKPDQWAKLQADLKAFDAQAGASLAAR